MTWLISLFLILPVSQASPFTWIRYRLASPEAAVIQARIKYLAALEYVPADRRQRLDRAAALAWAHASPDVATQELADKIEALIRSTGAAERVDVRFFATRALDSAYAELFDRFAAVEGAPLTFERVFASQLAQFEVRLARRWSAGLARVQEFIEYALPGEGPRAPRRFWSVVLSDDDSSPKRLTFSERRKRQMVREAAILPADLAGLMFAEAPPEPRRSAIAARLGFTFDEMASPLKFSFPEVESDAASIVQYRTALDAFDRMRGRLYRLEPSPMKDMLYRDVAILYHETLDELALLPLRRDPPESLATVPSGDPAWWNFGVPAEARPAPLAQAWAKTLNEAGQAHVAAMINLRPPPPPVDESCSTSFVDEAPKRREESPAEDWPPRPWGAGYRRFGPEWM